MVANYVIIGKCIGPGPAMVMHVEFCESIGVFIIFSILILSIIKLVPTIIINKSPKTCSCGKMFQNVYFGKSISVYLIVICLIIMNTFQIGHRVFGIS